MNEMIQNGAGEAVQQVAAAATPSTTLFIKGLVLMGAGAILYGFSCKFILEASRAAAIEGVEIAKLPVA